MLLSDVLSQSKLPEGLSGTLTAPRPQVLVLHSGACRIVEKVSAFAGPEPASFNLSGCVLCRNTTIVSAFTSRFRAAQRHLADLALMIRKAAELEDTSDIWGSSAELAGLRSSWDPAWRGEVEDDTNWSVEAHRFPELAPLIEEAVQPYLVELFSQEHFKAEQASKNLVLVVEDNLRYQGSEFILSQVPLRFAQVAGRQMVLIGVPPARRKELKERVYGNRVTMPVLSTRKPSTLLVSPEYDDTWKLAMELLENQFEDAVRAGSARSLSLDRLLSAAELAVK